MKVSCRNVYDQIFVKMVEHNIIFCFPLFRLVVYNFLFLKFV